MEVEVNKTRSMQLQFSVAASFKNLGTLGKTVVMDFFLMVELIKNGWEGPGLITRH